MDFKFKVSFIVCLISLLAPFSAKADIERKVKVSTNDSTAGYLNGKLVAGSNITFTENNDGANETLTIASSGGGGGASGTLTTLKENNLQVGDADIATLDFLGADFDLSESPDTEINVVIAAAITRDAEWDTSSEIAAAVGDETGSGALVFGTSPSFTTPNIGSATGSVSGNAGTATALAANGSNCSAGNYPLGVDASGAVESCTAAGSGDITSVGDVASGAAFDGTQGTILTFQDAGGDHSIALDATNDLFVFDTTLLLGSNGILISSDGDGAFIVKSGSAGSQEDLIMNLDDTANTARMSSTTGLNLIDYATNSIDVSVLAEAYDATGWNSDVTVPQKDAVRDKIETMPQIAGRSLTLSSTTVDADSELYTDAKCVNIDPAATTTSWFMWRAPHDITITGVDCIVDASTSVVLTPRECDGNGANCSDIEAAITCATTNTTEASSVDNASVDAGDYIRVTRGTVSGSPTQAVICLEYTKND